MLSQVAVISFLSAYGGGVAVSGQHRDILGQGEHLALQHADEGILVAAGEVAAAYLAVEEAVAAQQDALALFIEAYAAGGFMLSSRAARCRNMRICSAAAA